MTLRPGDILAGKYQIISEIGEGGFGKTYLGHDLGMDRPVAIKELLQSAATTNPEEYESYQMRFRKEARIVSKFSHPNVVSAYALETDEEGNLYLILEYVGGGSLKNTLEKDELLDNERVIQIGIDICNAIEAIYRRDIVHRDIKPSNILLTEEGQAKLTDFGVAQLGQETRRTQTARGHPGTPAYKSPEQANTTGYLDERSDLYSLGLVMYEMLTNKLYVRNYIPPEAYNAKVSPRLSKMIMRALEEAPLDRYQSAAEMREDLLRLRQKGLGSSLQTAVALAGDSPLFRVVVPFLLVVAAGVLIWAGMQVYNLVNARGLFASTPTPVAAAPTLTPTHPPVVVPTRVPTATPVPTSTPRPTNTVVPTPVFTPTTIPTKTPVLTDQYEPNDINPSPIAVGETQTHSFYPTGDVDKVTFRAKAGRWYVVSTGNLAVGVDTRLELWVAGERYENDDAVPGQLASLIQFRSPAEVMVVVTITNLDQFGPHKYYDISVMELPPTLTPTVTETPSPTMTWTNTPTNTPTETPTLTRTPTVTPTWTWTPTVTLTRTPVPSPTFTTTPTLTPVPPTDTPVPPTNTPVPPTNTPVPPTDTPVPPTNTPVPPTDTPVPPTNTPVPPTNTPVPPTNTPRPPTHTPVPPTNTPVPPTNLSLIHI